MNPRELAMADEARSRLGRGLASLIGDVGGEAAHLERPRAQRKVPIEFLKPNPRNPRRAFSESELQELASSIKQHGVIQPIAVRPVKGTPDRYEIIAGERRWRASQMAGLHEVPIVPLDVSDRTRSSLRSSRTCSARISTRWRRRRAITRSPMNSNAARKTSQRSSAKAAAMSPT